MSDQKPTQDTPKLANTKHQKDKSFSQVWFFLVALLIIAALVFGQYRIETLLLKQSALEQQLQSLASQSQQHSIERGKQATHLEQSQQALKEMQGRLAFMQQTLDQIPGARVDDWKLAEIEYLLRLANQRVYLQHELTAAHGLFDAANQILANLDNPALLVVREQIAKEMLLLGQHSQLDRQGIYTQLQAIKQLIHDGIQPPQTFKQTKTEVMPSADEKTLWQQLIALVSIRHRDDAFNAPLTNSQYQLLEHNLNLMLEQAQWALLKADSRLYQDSLNHAQQWLTDNLRHSGAQTIAAKLQALAAIDVQQTTPNVSESLRLLRQILQERTFNPSDVKPKQNKTPSTNKKINNQQEQA
ncbi:hypothetical protein NBRC116188_14120 [Oceaniserpentilla sp. 4NH20-0058]|uniref:uroporphyrinogen-III C-methyltransferase n=1 Tax=Oceaniserpentilla sp. 4NH20-0058 TaxID=3127660 RepID=UPI003109FBCD